MMKLSDGRGKEYSRLPVESNEALNDKETKHTRQAWRKTTLAALFAIILFCLVSIAAFTSSAYPAEKHDKSGANLSALLSSSADSNLIPSYIKYETGISFRAATIGSNLTLIPLPMIQMIKPADGQDLQGKAFNLALMRLPIGARWEYIAVTRGPKKYHQAEIVKGNKGPAMISSVLGFGLNMTRDGRLRPVSKATFLHIRTIVSQFCNDANENGWSGPEDARLYWSDSGTPMMTVGIPSTAKHCKGIALVQDVRSVWPELAAVLALPNILVKPFVAGIPQYEMMEITKEDQRNAEKNWMPFFTGPKPNANASLPTFLYSASPQITLDPPLMSKLDTGSFLPIAHYSNHRVDSSSDRCLKAAYPHIDEKRHHGATPLYRLTLCNRGDCQPSSNNTYLLSLTHILREDNHLQHHTYSRYASLRSVDPPHTLVAVGPPLSFTNTSDSDIVYAISLSFKTSSVEKEQSTAHLGPTHGFLDDEIIIGLGLVDDQLATLKVSLKQDLLSKMVSCSDQRG